jgi:hypothetical protein
MLVFRWFLSSDSLLARFALKDRKSDAQKAEKELGGNR